MERLPFSALVGPPSSKGFSLRDVAEATCQEYHDQAMLWKVMKKKLPASLDEMEQPLQPGEPPFAIVEDDPWGNPYVLEHIGSDEIRVTSRGPDGRKGTEDDIVYPRRK